MAMTIDCVCDDVGKRCEMSRLDFVVENLNWLYGSVELAGGPVPISFTHGVGKYPLTPIESWQNAWDDLYVIGGAQRSLLSKVVDHFKIVFYIQATFSCEGDDVPTSQLALPAVSSDTDVFYCFDGATLRAIASASSGILYGSIIDTAPLQTDCGGFVIQSGHFTPDFKNFQVVDVSDPKGDVCLCIQGGNPPYRYSIDEGYPPSGVFFHYENGCFMGMPDGKYQGSGEITITVVDRSNQVATITCKYSYCRKLEERSNRFY